MPSVHEQTFDASSLCHLGTIDCLFSPQILLKISKCKDSSSTYAVHLLAVQVAHTVRDLVVPVVVFRGCVSSYLSIIEHFERLVLVSLPKSHKLENRHVSFGLTIFHFASGKNVGHC